MKEVFHICDMCGKQEKASYYSIPQGWEQIEVKYRSYSVKELSVCDECAAKLGLPLDTTNKTSQEQKNIADRLLEIVEEIAYGVQSQ